MNKIEEFEKMERGLKFVESKLRCCTLKNSKAFNSNLD